MLCEALNYCFTAVIATLAVKRLSSNSFPKEPGLYCLVSPTKSFIVTPADTCWSMSKGIEVVSLAGLLGALEETQCYI